jgi:tyrosyl-tRNA synthetase
MYGKILSIPDEVMPTYYKYALFYGNDEVEKLKKDLTDGTLHPRDAKRRLAREVVARYTSEGTARKAEEEFDRIFIAKSVPEDIESFQVGEPTPIVDIIVNAGLAGSKGEGKRLIQGGGVSIDGDKVEDVNFVFHPGTESVLKVGKRRFLKLVS